ncbi:AEC family transporter [Candidatus Sumerlaeota bacterium]|nr:AEC family transporter [Candidatus Sumerlaeota bacterium]
MNSVVLRTLVPILLLAGAGFFSRMFKALHRGDERVLSSYIYYFALPALLLVNMAEIRFNVRIMKFVLAAILPTLIIFSLVTIVHIVFHLSRKVYYLLVICSIFGSHSFFGLPFIMFAFATRESERLAVLSSSFIAIFAVSITITILEMFKMEDASPGKGFRTVLKKLSRNPLILSILTGLFFSILRIPLPIPVIRPLHMLGNSAAPVAIFMLGVSLFGRNYQNLKTAFLLSLIRMLALPVIAVFIMRLVHIEEMEGVILILMHASPMALATIVLSERYDFRQDVIPSLMLVSSLSAPIYMNIWLIVLGHR